MKALRLFASLLLASLGLIADLQAQGIRLGAGLSPYALQVYDFVQEKQDKWRPCFEGGAHFSYATPNHLFWMLDLTLGRETQSTTIGGLAGAPLVSSNFWSAAPAFGFWLGKQDSPFSAFAALGPRYSNFFNTKAEIDGQQQSVLIYNRLYGQVLFGATWDFSERLSATATLAHRQSELEDFFQLQRRAVVEWGLGLRLAYKW